MSVQPALGVPLALRLLESALAATLVLDLAVASALPALLVTFRPEPTVFVHLALDALLARQPLDYALGATLGSASTVLQ